MKKLLLFVTLLVLSVTSYAQHKDVTKFLGIPVDGSKSAMIKKLKAKGFTSNPYNNDYLVGQFNGADVHVYVVTNNNKVCRIMVSDANTMDEADIKIRFNTLCQQFQNNNKYISSSDNVISDKEDISHEMLVNSKRYEADFLQMAEAIDSVAMSKEIESILLKKYSKEQVSNLSEEQKKVRVRRWKKGCKRVGFIYS